MAMYVDTSVLVKLFTSEPETGFYTALVENKTLASSALAFSEMWSALLGKERDGSIRAAQRHAAWDSFRFRLDHGLITLVPVTRSVLHRANRFLERAHPRVALRTLDALHLASCDLAQEG